MTPTEAGLVVVAGLILAASSAVSFSMRRYTDGLIFAIASLGAFVVLGSLIN